MAEITNMPDVGAPDQVDRISDLPDDVISNILSRLPTIQAMRTSALSRKWKHKWTTTYDISIHADEIIPVERYHSLNENERDIVDAKFQGFVDKVLDSLHGSRIRSFCLCIGYLHERDYVLGLISRLVNLSLEKLSIACCDDLYIVLPRLFECCSSLTELSVSLGCTMEVHVKNSFPKLQKLYLGGGSDGMSTISIINKQSHKTGHLLLFFPVLEDFELAHTFDFLDVNLVEIDTPELISFKVSGPEFPNDYVMKIRAPKLVKFITYCGPAYDFVLSTPSLCYVEFLGPSTEASQVTTLLKGAPDLEFLRLFGEFNLTDQALPTFYRLKQLEADLSKKDMWKLLRAAPYIESLSMQMFEDDDSNYSPEPFLPFPQLKHVTLGYFKGVKSDLEMVRFFFEKAKKLDGMIVYSASWVDMEDVKTRISSLGLENSSRITVLKGS